MLIHGHKNKTMSFEGNESIQLTGLTKSGHWVSVSGDPGQLWKQLCPSEPGPLQVGPGKCT